MNSEQDEVIFDEDYQEILIQYYANFTEEEKVLDILYWGDQSYFKREEEE